LPVSASKKRRSRSWTANRRGSPTSIGVATVAGEVLDAADLELGGDPVAIAGHELLRQEALGAEADQMVAV